MISMIFVVLYDILHYCEKLNIAAYSQCYVGTEVSWLDPEKNPHRKRDSNPGSSALEADALPLGQRGGRKPWIY